MSDAGTRSHGFRLPSKDSRRTKRWKAFGSFGATGSDRPTRLYAARLAGHCAPDVVLEEINTLPYLAPLWSSAPVLLYMNQLARDVWWHEAALPFAAIGWTIEPWYLRVYRGCDAVTISLSTLADLHALGIGRRATIAPMAVEAVPIANITDSLLTVWLDRDRTAHQLER